MSQDTHSHVAFSHGEALSRQHVCLHKILHVDPVHARPAVPKPEHEQSLLDVALAWGEETAQVHLRGFTLCRLAHMLDSQLLCPKSSGHLCLLVSQMTLGCL